MSTPIVPMADLAAQVASLSPELEEAVLGVLRSGAYILGDTVSTFERAMADYSGAAHGIGVGNGTDALFLALLALGVGPGDEVVTPAFTFVATVETVALLGATPVFADIDPVSYTLDPDDVARKMTERTKVVLPVHLFGQAADLDRLESIAGPRGASLLADGAQSAGTGYRGVPVATRTPLTTLSFYPTKNLGAAGDGGMVLANTDDLAQRLRLLRFHGSSGTYDYREVGVCSRLDALQAAILSVKLARLEAWNDARRANAAYYHGAFTGIDGLTLPFERCGDRHTYHQYTVRVGQGRRDALKQHLAERGIASGVFYPVALHLAPAYRERHGGRPGDHPESERACAEVLSLPVFPELESAKRESVADAVRSFFNA
ncbi:MAG: DegT/DnrJ/EryC1/StrS family aminotransferase [Armatimonadota bacterium]